MKILLLSTYHPLAQHIGGRRWAALSEELAFHIHSILQVASNRLLPHSLLNTSSSSRLHSNNYQVLTSSYPYLHFIKLILLSFLRNISANFRAPSLASADLSANQTRHRSYSFLGSIKKLPRKVFGLLFLNSISEEKSWARKAFNQHRSQVDNFNPDIIVASYPLWGPIFLAEMVSNHLGIPLILDVRDPISQDPQLPVGYKGLYEKIETRILNKAIAVFCINKTVASFLASSNGLHQKLCICPNPVNISSCSNDFYALANSRYRKLPSSSDGVTRLGYFGTIHTQSLVPEYLTALAKVCTLDKAKFSIKYFGRDFQKLSSFFPESLNNSLKNFGYVNLKEEYSTIAGNTDIFILAGFPGPLGKCVMTGKIFDYIPFGKPIVAFCQKGDELSRFILESRIGICLFSVNEIFDAFLDTAGLVSYLSTSYNPDLSYLKSFCVDQVALKIDNLITSSVSAQA